MVRVARVEGGRAGRFGGMESVRVAAQVMDVRRRTMRARTERMV